MITALRWLGMGIVTLLLAYVVFLGARIVEQRSRAPKVVAQAIARMDYRIDAIPPLWLEKLIKVEDPTFWTNDGIDLLTPGAGMTTLSQGLGKRIFFRRFTPGPLGKIELMALTKFALTPKVSKRDILRAMLALAYLGEDDNGPVIGFAEGARRWYGKQLDALKEREFLGLVAMLPAPNDLDPQAHPEQNAERVGRMQRLILGVCRPLSLKDVALDGCAL